MCNKFKQITAISAYTKYGIYPSSLVQAMSTAPHLDSLTDALSEYYLLYWRGDYILEMMQDGVIISNGTIYHVCFSSDLSRGKIMNGSGKDKQYRLSFRKAAAEYNLPAYVYITE